MIRYEITNKISANGTAYTIGEVLKPMRIPNELLDAIFYLYSSKQAAEAKENAGGTGFLVARKSDVHDEIAYIYAITNKHVIIGPNGEQRAPVVRLNTLMGKTDIIEATKQNWMLSDTQDIAISAIGLNESVHKFKCIPTDIFLLKDSSDYKEVGAGSDLFFMGRYTWHQGKERNIPTVRFGTIAMMPNEPIYYQEYGQYFTNYLAEARSIRGFSGSPTFMYIPPFGAHSDGSSTNLMSIWFLGLVSSSFPQVEPIRDAAGKPTDMSVEYNSGIMMVVPAWDVLELINSEPLMNLRKENDNKISEEKKKQSPSLDYASIEDNMTKQKFDSALKKVSTKTNSEKPDQSKPKT